MTTVALKICTKCQRELSVDDFGADRTKKDGLTSQCTTCRRRTVKACKDRTRDRLNARERARYRENLCENRRRARKRSREHYHRNSEAIRAKKIPEMRDRYMSKKRDMDHETLEFVNLVLRNDPCAYCGTSTDIVIDHIEPYSKGGSSGADNLTAACNTCNLSKREFPMLSLLLRLDNHVNHDLLHPTSAQTPSVNIQLRKD